VVIFLLSEGTALNIPGLSTLWAKAQTSLHTVASRLLPEVSFEWVWWKIVVQFMQICIGWRITRC